MTERKITVNRIEELARYRVEKEIKKPMYTDEDIELYNKIKKMYIDKKINYNLERIKLTANLFGCENSAKQDYVTLIVFYSGILISGIMSMLGNMLLIYCILVAIIIGIISLKYHKTIVKRNYNIKYYTICLSVLDEVEKEEVDVKN